MSDLTLTDEEKKQVEEFVKRFDEWAETDEYKDRQEQRRQEAYERKLERRKQRKEMFRKCPSLGPYFHRPLKP